MMSEKGQEDKTYLITKDLVPTLVRRLHLALTPCAGKRIHALEEEFLKNFWGFIEPHPNHVVMSSRDLGIATEEFLLQEDLPVVSLDEVYFRRGVDHYISTTRLTDPHNLTADPVLGPRPGHLPIQAQLDYLRSELGNESVVLVDVGAFSGDSLIDLTAMFRKSNIPVEKIILSLAGYEGIQRIEQDIPLEVLNPFNFGEWIELRDFFGIDGRKIDASNLDGYKNERLFIPYMEGHLGKWASIPEENWEKFRDYCRHYSSKLRDILNDDGTNLSLEPESVDGLKNVYRLTHEVNRT